MNEQLKESGNIPNDRTTLKGELRMNRKEQTVLNFLENLFATRSDEIQCDIAQDLLCQCAAEHFSDEEARQRYPQLFYHFRYCPDCEEEYQVSMEYVRSQVAGLVQRPNHIPPLPAWPPISKTNLEPGAESNPVPSGAYAAVVAMATPVINVIKQVREAATLGLATASTRGLSLSERWISLDMEGGEVILKLKAERDPKSAGYYRLFCTIKTTHPALTAALEGELMELRSTASGEAVQEQELSEEGDTLFTQIAPGNYELYWQIAAQSFAATGLEIL